MEVKFVVPGEPKGKQRPRICRIRGGTIAYTPKQTTEYEKMVRTSAVAEIKNFEQQREPCCSTIRASYTADSKIFFEKDIPLEVSITALFSIPKSASKKIKAQMSDGDMLPTKKPDADNIIKIILDALNGVAYYDDSQICSVHFEKKYAETPKTEIIIKEINL